MRSDWKTVAKDWKHFEESIVGKCMKLQNFREKIIMKQLKKDTHSVPSTSEIRNAVPYLRTLAIFRWKTFLDRFLYLLFLLFCFKCSSLFVYSIKFNFLVLFRKRYYVEVCLISYDNSLRPPVERLRTLISVAVLFNPRNTISSEIGSTIRLWAD